MAGAEANKSAINFDLDAVSTATSKKPEDSDVLSFDSIIDEANSDLNFKLNDAVAEIENAKDAVPAPDTGSEEKPVFNLDEAVPAQSGDISESMKNALNFDESKLADIDPRNSIKAEGVSPEGIAKEDPNALDADEEHALAGMPGVRMMKDAEPQKLVGKDALMYIALSPIIYGQRKLDQAKVKKWQAMDARRSVDAAIDKSRDLAELMNGYKQKELKNLSKFIADTGMTHEQFNHSMKHDSKFQEAYKDKILKQFESLTPEISYELDRRRQDLMKSWVNAERAARATGADIEELRESHLNEVLESSKNLATGVNPDGTLKMEEEKTKEMMDKLKEAIQAVVKAITRALRIS